MRAPYMLQLMLPSPAVRTAVLASSESLCMTLASWASMNSRWTAQSARLRGWSGVFAIRPFRSRAVMGFKAAARLAAAGFSARGRSAGHAVGDVRAKRVQVPRGEGDVERSVAEACARSLGYYVPGGRHGAYALHLA